VDRIEIRNPKSEIRKKTEIRNPKSFKFRDGFAKLLFSMILPAMISPWPGADRIGVNSGMAK
jgi:hypothetical protein